MASVVQGVDIAYSELRSLKSLETLVKMGERIGVHPASHHLHSNSIKYSALAELEEQTGHIMSIDQAQAAIQTIEGAWHL